jgi:hypothetical protein
MILKERQSWLENKQSMTISFQLLISSFASNWAIAIKNVFASEQKREDVAAARERWQV